MKPAPEPNPPITTQAPAYEDVARAYNEHVKDLSTFFASTIVRMKWTEDDGKQRSEQGEGRLQIVRPNKVAMSVGKVGEVFFWLGCDESEYWWFDLSGKPRILFLGKHAKYATSQARRVGVVVAPLDLLKLTGLAPIPDTGGKTQRSADGRLIGATFDLEGGARERVWIDPSNSLPTKIELYNPAGALELVADLSQPDGVEVRGIAERPRVNTRIAVGHHASQSEIIIDLSDMQDGRDRIVPEAFDLRTLAARLRAEKAYGLDLPPIVRNRP